LQLSNLELAAFVEQELEKNPLLEHAEEAPADAPFEDDAAGEGGDDEAPLDADYGNVYDAEPPAEGAGGAVADGGAQDWGRGGRTDFGDSSSLEETLSRPKGLREHLEEQLGADVADPADRLVCRHLVDLVDETGYITADFDAVAAQLGCERARVERAVALMQRCDPPGVFARSLSECLALQLADRGRLSPAMEALLANLDLVARRDLAALAERCRVDEDTLVDMVREIRTLDPKPGLAFADEVVQTVVPDVIVRPRGEGGWAVELNTETLPRVLVNNRYHARVSRGASGREERAFITHNLQSANWLVKALDQRANTILKVATELVRLQDAFLAKGVRHLRPLTLRDVAEAVEMHESTISRVTTSKFMATPRGIYELKYFFSSAIASTGGGESHSSEAIRHRIRELIDGESPSAVLSDDRLVAILAANGIDIARRTVAKYRESMRIPSSVQRRRLKSARI
jgi:RNA polymerase sigma-54 factor